MLGSQHHEGRPPQRVGSSGEHDDLVSIACTKRDFGPLRTPDPVGLHGLDRIRPVDASEIEQLVGVLGDGEEPLFHQLLDDRLAGAFVLAIDDLLVGEDGLQCLRPIDHRLVAVGDAMLIHPLEEPLRPSVIGRIAAHRLPFPIEHGSH